MKQKRLFTVLSIFISTLIFSLMGMAHADSLFSDGFESGNFSAWSSVGLGGDGTATVQNTTVRSGQYAAKLSESVNSGSKAYVRKSLSAAQQDVTATGDFQVTQQGPTSSGNVPIFRFFDPNSSRLLSLYRQNGSGQIGLSIGGSYYSSSGTLPLNTWANVGLHVITNGSSSTVQVFYNGNQVYQTSTASLGTLGTQSVQIGNDTAAQQFTAIVDNVSVQNASTTTPVAPTNNASPAISGTAQSGQTLTASTGSWSGTQPIAYAYQWLRCNSSGASCVNITGAVSNTYQATDADVSSSLAVKVTASNSAGSSSATSAPTAVVSSASAPTGGVVALWHMDETSGTTMYDSAGSHNGTIYKATLGLPGFAGSSYGFNGSSSYVSVPSASNLNPGSANITVTIHLKTTGTPPPAPADWDLIRKGLYTSGGSEYKMEFQHNGQASCGFEGSNGYSELAAGPAINNGQWHTVQCVKTSTNIQVVVDGVVYTKTANIGTISNSSPVVIGARPGSDWYNGQLDEASIQIN